MEKHWVYQPVRVHAAEKVDESRSSAHTPVTRPCSRRIVDNNDPDNSGRVKVQFYWQEDNQTQWMTMMAPHAGADRGFMFLPEVGDEVWVAFEEGDPERGRVLGCAWNGVSKPPREDFWGSDVGPNDVKRIVTRADTESQSLTRTGKTPLCWPRPSISKCHLLKKAMKPAIPCFHSILTATFIKRPQWPDSFSQ